MQTAETGLIILRLSIQNIVWLLFNAFSDAYHVD